MSTEEKMASEETFDENEKMNAGETKTEPAADGAGTEEAPEENTVSEETPEEKAASEGSEEIDADPGETAGQEASEEEQAEDREPEEESDKVGLFGGKKLKKELEKKAEQISELTDRNMRLMAEFDNYRKRTEKEKAAMYEIGAKDIIEKILPVLDNFERGLTTVPEEEKENPFVQGMDKIYKQFVKTLEDIGVKPMDAAGKPFDPNFHNAVMMEETDEFESNKVSGVMQKGYTLNSKVIRPSMVKVAQ